MLEKQTFDLAQLRQVKQQVKTAQTLGKPCTVVVMPKDKGKDKDREEKDVCDLMTSLSIGPSTPTPLQDLLAGRPEAMRQQILCTCKMLCPRRDFEKDKLEGGINELTFKLMLMMLLRVDGNHANTMVSELPLYEYHTRSSSKRPANYGRPVSYMDCVLSCTQESTIVLFELKSVPVRHVMPDLHTAPGKSTSRTDIEQHYGTHVARIQHMDMDDLGHVLVRAQTDTKGSTTMSDTTIGSICEDAMNKQLVPYFQLLAGVPISTGQNLFFPRRSESKSVTVWLYAIVLCAGNTFWQLQRKIVSRV